MAFSYLMLGARWKQVIFAIFLLLLPILAIIISLKDYSDLNNNEVLLSNIDNLFTVGGETLAALIALLIAGKMKDSRFGPGMGLLALSMIFLALSDGLWWANELIKNLYIVPKYGNNELMASGAWINWIIIVSEHYFSLFEGVFVVLAALALRDCFNIAQQLQIEIDKEKSKIEVSKVVETDYFKKIRTEAISLRKNRDKP
jgi:hypothetical protein